MVHALATRMLAALSLENAELSVHLVDDPGITTLNRDYRGLDRPTDVLAFTLDGAEGEDRADAPPRQLGDVVISLDTAARQARAGRRSLRREVAWLLAHGLLHLVGYDHRTRAQKRRMDARARSLLGGAAKA